MIETADSRGLRQGWGSRGIPRAERGGKLRQVQELGLSLFQIAREFLGNTFGRMRVGERFQESGELLEGDSSIGVLLLPDPRVLTQPSNHGDTNAFIPAVPGVSDRQVVYA